MPPHNGDSAAASHAARPRRGPVVPAIPLALSRPKMKPARLQPATVTNAAPAGEQEKPMRGKMNGDKEQEVPKAAEVEAQVEDVTQPELLTNGQMHTSEANEGTKPSLNTLAMKRSSSMFTSNGAIPELPTDRIAEQSASVVNASADTSSPTVTASPSVALRDKFDIRQLKTELPPAFVPLADQQTPHSAHSATSSQTRPYPQLPHAHPVHPSAGNIVFGGHDSSTSSPGPPLSASSSHAPPQAQYPPLFVNHNHHASEHQAQRTQQLPQQQPPMPWGMRPYGASGPQPFYHPHAHMPFRYQLRESFAPVVPLLNGLGPRSRSGSHASSGPHDGHRPGNDPRSPAAFEQPDSAKALFPDQKTAAFPAQHRQIPSQQMQTHPAALPHPDIAASMENAGTMRDYVLSQWLNPEIADCHLQVVEAEGDGRTYIDGHKIILSRSSTLATLIKSSEPPESPSLNLQVRVELQGQHIRIGHFYEAVRYLYGGPLPRFDFYRGLDSNDERMKFALGFIAIGAWLRIPAIAHQSIDIAASFLQWETYQAALAFALDGGLNQAWSISDGSEERSSTCSSDDSFAKPEAGGSPTYDAYSNGLLHRIIEFTVHNFPPNFYLDQAAPQTASCPRLPAFKMKHESKSSRSDPRLSKIRFGEIPVEDHQRPSLTTSTISSILLSLPFPLLKYLLEHPILSSRLGPETVGSIMRQVVHEREVRRQKALQSRTIGSNDDASDLQQIQNLYWEEAVEQSAHHRAGFRLARRRRGIDTPPSSGAESERLK